MNCPSDSDAEPSFTVPVWLGHGVGRVPVPIAGLPLKMAYTMVYVIETARGPVLVDAGWDDSTAWEALTQGARTLGFDVTDVYGVVVTHHHPDHAGLADRIRRVSGAWVALHVEDAKTARQVDDSLRDRRGFLRMELQGLRDAGAPDEVLGEFESSGGNGELARLGWCPDREVREGALLDVPGRSLRVVWTPGHSPGHMCLHLDTPDWLFSGDHVLSDTTPNIGLYADDPVTADPLGDYLTSLDRIAATSASKAFPAHERSIVDVGARAMEIKEHHLRRLEEMLASFDQPTTLWAAAASMRWSRPWEELSPADYQLCIAEAAAHLRFLTRRDVVREIPGVPPSYVAGRHPERVRAARNGS